MDLTGYGLDDPIVVGVQRRGAPAEFKARGRTATGEPLTAGTVVYTASLSKQITAACAALLVRRGRLDTTATLDRWMPELPSWAGTVAVHHLIHHTSGIPEVITFDDLVRDGVHRTGDGVIGALAETGGLTGAPGTEFRYCNAGYVCLATVVERAAGRPLPDFAREQVFAPLGMSDTRFWSGPAPHPPGAAPTRPGSPAALSLGDGGVWSTAPDLLRWNTALERDELGVSALMHTPGRLTDGTVLDYAWALGVRTYAGGRVFRHGGRWAGLSAQLVRLADHGAGFVILALDDDEDRTVTLADTLLKRASASSL